jgi:hypothetical protein
VFRAVIENLFGTGSKFVVLIDSTVRVSDPVAARAEWRERMRTRRAVLDSETVEDYMQANRTRAAIDPAFGYRLPIKLMSDSLRKTFEARGKILVDAAEKNHSSTVDMVVPFWTGFYDAFPGAHGYGSLSKPGYNHEHTRALMEFGQGCGSLCGEWGFITLEKGSGGWYVKVKVVEVVS